MERSFDILGQAGIADIIFVSACIILVLLLLFRRSSHTVKKLPAREGITGYKLIYADQKTGRKNEEGFGKVLYSSEYELHGKPDLIFKGRFGKKIVPVELKSGSIGEEEYPHRGDLLQLGAYFLIIEDVYKIRPKYGRLIYQDYMFFIKNTKAMRREVSQTLKEMREMLTYGVGKANPSFANCRFCICNGTVCTYSETEIDGGEENDTSCGEE